MHLVAHRGHPARYPENSLVGIAAAVAVGARFVEIDVQLSADRVPVVLHDAELHRTAAHHACALDLAWNDLRTLDVGEPARFGAAFRGTPLPSLAQVVELLATHRDVHLFVELKRDSLSRHGIDAVVPIVLETLAPLRGRFSVISFDEPCLRLSRDLDDAPIGLILDDVDDASRCRAEALAPRLLFCNRRLLAPPLTPWPGEWAWAVYTVDDPAEAAAFASRGVELVETDDIVALLRSR